MPSASSPWSGGSSPRRPSISPTTTRCSPSPVRASSGSASRSRATGWWSPRACRSTSRGPPTCSRSKPCNPMRVTLLGTGTAFGVPQCGCDCAVCRSTDPRDRRSRTAALIETGGAAILIDTPPELRLQLLAAPVTPPDPGPYTHLHADHVNGIDDLRIFSERQRDPLPVHGSAETVAFLRERYRYIFDDDVVPYQIGRASCRER